MTSEEEAREIEKKRAKSESDKRYREKNKEKLEEEQ